MCRSRWRKLSVQGRGKFYDGNGAIRDVVQNHMMQVVGLLAMDPPASIHHEAIRDGVVKVFRETKPLTGNDIVRGQFEGYKNEPGVLAGDHDASRDRAEAPADYRSRAGRGERLAHPLGPKVGMTLGIRVKKSGEEMTSEASELSLAAPPAADEMEPYERLLGDAMNGDQSLFAREDAVEAAWRIVDPILDNATMVHAYAKESWGPQSADNLTARWHGWKTPK